MKTHLMGAVLWLCLVAGPAWSQNGPLQVQVNAYNGAELQTPTEEERFDDPSIRVEVNMTNPTEGRIKVNSVNGTFLDAEGNLLSKDQQGPVTIGSGQTGQVILYYANPSSLYQFKLDGRVHYESQDQNYSAPFHVNDTQDSPPPYNDQ